eukprot:scaffold473_cov104-Isochrysis_galbana.AAC.2
MFITVATGRPLAHIETVQLRLSEHRPGRVPRVALRGGGGALAIRPPGLRRRQLVLRPAAPAPPRLEL